MQGAPYVSLLPSVALTQAFHRLVEILEGLPFHTKIVVMTFKGVCRSYVNNIKQLLSVDVIIFRYWMKQKTV